MVKPKISRIVSSLPGVTYFKPAGIPLRMLSEIRLSVEEAEALRLKDLEGLEQIEAAVRMGVSRSTFQRVLYAARKKVADALLNGKAIRIEGGSFQVAGAGPGCLRGQGEHGGAAVENQAGCLFRNKTGESEPQGPHGRAVDNNLEKENHMTYAVPTSGGKLSQHFGQSTEFMIIDTDGKGKITGRKTISAAAHNCGSLPQLLAGLGTKTVLGGGMGMGPRMAFENAGIEVVLGVAETDPEKAVLAHANHTLVGGQNACGHADTVCDHSGEHEEHQGRCR